MIRSALFVMIWTAVSVTAPGAAMGFAPKQKPEATDPYRPRTTEFLSPVVEVPIVERGGQPTVRVMINGIGPVTLALDTAMTGLTLAEDMLRVLKLRAVEATGFMNASKDRRAGSDRGGFGLITQVGSLSIGTFSEPAKESQDLAAGVVFGNFMANVVRPAELQQDRVRFTGKVGVSFFERALLTIDDPRSRLILKRGEISTTQREKSIEYKVRGGYPVVSMSFGDLAVDLVIDSLSREAYTLTRSLRATLLRGAAFPSGGGLGRFSGERTKGSGGPRFISIPKVPPFRGTVRFAGFDIIEPPLVFHRGESRVGHAVLRHFRLTLDQKNRRILVQRDSREGITFPPSEPKFGLIFLRAGAGIRIHEIIEGSPAANSPLAKGYFITELDGQSVLGLDDESFTSYLQNVNRVVFKASFRGLGILVPLEDG